MKKIKLGIFGIIAIIILSMGILNTVVQNFDILLKNKEAIWFLIIIVFAFTNSKFSEYFL